MKLKKLSLRNIRSYSDLEIEFPEGSTLLAGDIGSGKTSILLAIEYSLFGLQPGQRGLSLLRNSTDYGFVSLELELGGKNIIIERKLRRNNKTVTNEYASIKIDNEKLEASLTEIKIKILELMGYPQEFIKKNNLLYRYTVYTPQEQMKQIILEDAETRLNILRHTLGIDKYKRIRENLTVLLNYLKEESKLLQGEIKTLDEEKSQLELRKAGLQIIEKEIITRACNFDAKTQLTRKIGEELLHLESKIKEKEYLEKEVEKTKIMLSNKYENRLTLDSELQNIERIIAEIYPFNEEEHRKTLVQITKESERIEFLNSKYASLITEVGSLEKQQQETITKKERIFKIDICPTCLQDVPEAHKHNILNETENFLSRTKNKISFIEKEISAVAKELESAKSLKKNLEEQKSSQEILKMKLEYAENSKKRREELYKARKNLEQDISILEKHIFDLKGKIFELSKFDNLARQKKESLKEALQEERKAEVALAEIKRELSLAIIEISVQEQRIAVKEESKKNLSRLLELYDWLSVNFLELIEFTERNVLLKLRQEFSRVFSKWFSMLVPQGSLGVRLDESFSPIILHNGIEMEFSFISGGERTAIALAYRLSLNQTINSMLSKIRTKDIIILDEPTDGFSEAQLDRMNKVLQELKVSQLIIVSHEQKIEDFVDNIVKIKKAGDSSYLEHDAPILQDAQELVAEKLKYPQVID